MREAPQNLTPKDFFWIIYEDNGELGEKMRRDFRDLQLKNLDQRRALIGYIPGFSAAIIALSAQIINGNINLPYLKIGLVLYLISIFYILAYLREKLDVDSRALSEQQHKYSEIVDLQRKKILEYLLKSDLSESDISEYKNFIQNEPRVKQLENDISADKERWAARNTSLEFSSEIGISVFVIASFFMLASVLNWHFGNTILTVILIFLVFISFVSSATFLTNFISTIINWFRNLEKK